VRARHGRATVIGVGLERPSRESDPPSWFAEASNGTRKSQEISDDHNAYFVGAEEGATSLIPGMYVHEFVHDGRHLLGFPCH
jgi:hypothetical protein